MPVGFDCSHCGKRVGAKDELAGKEGKCSHCGELLRVPSHPTRRLIVDHPIELEDLLAAVPPGPQQKQSPEPQERPEAEEEPGPEVAQQEQTPPDEDAIVEPDPPPEPAVRIVEDAEIPPSTPPAREQSSAIGFDCPKCHAKITLASKLAGREVGCPNCGGSLKIPEGDVSSADSQGALDFDDAALSIDILPKPGPPPIAPRAFGTHLGLPFPADHLTRRAEAAGRPVVLWMLIVIFAFCVCVHLALAVLALMAPGSKNPVIYGYLLWSTVYCIAQRGLVRRRRWARIGLTAWLLVPFLSLNFLVREPPAGTLHRMAYNPFLCMEAVLIVLSPAFFIALWLPGTSAYIRQEEARRSVLWGLIGLILAAITLGVLFLLCCCVWWPEWVKQFLSG